MERLFLETATYIALVDRTGSKTKLKVKNKRKASRIILEAFFMQVDSLASGLNRPATSCLFVSTLGVFRYLDKVPKSDHFF